MEEVTISMVADILGVLGNNSASFENCRSRTKGSSFHEGEPFFGTLFDLLQKKKRMLTEAKRKFKKFASRITEDGEQVMTVEDFLKSVLPRGAEIKEVKRKGV